MNAEVWRLSLLSTEAIAYKTMKYFSAKFSSVILNNWLLSVKINKLHKFDVIYLQKKFFCIKMCQILKQTILKYWNKFQNNL